VLETPGDGGAMRSRAPREGERALLAPRDDESVLIELRGPGERAIVFGCGHVGRALGPMLAALGFEVVLADDGETGALDPRPPWASAIVESFDVADVERALGGRLGAGDHVLILTRDHAIDQQILEDVIDRDELSYLGLIGSRGKVGRFEKRLRAKGLLGEHEARWARLSAPIGLDLGSETPAEIAVAVAAELVARRRRGKAPA
jgi:xanthine dehydrogenase accessory factor